MLTRSGMTPSQLRQTTPPRLGEKYGCSRSVNGALHEMQAESADPEKMYESLTGKLAKLGDDVVLYPGHDYADRPTSTIGDEKRTNVYLRVPTLDAWMRTDTGHSVREWARHAGVVPVQLGSGLHNVNTPRDLAALRWIIPE